MRGSLNARPRTASSQSNASASPAAEKDARPLPVSIALSTSTRPPAPSAMPSREREIGPPDSESTTSPASRGKAPVSVRGVPVAAGRVANVASSDVPFRRMVSGPCPIETARSPEPTETAIAPISRFASGASRSRTRAPSATTRPRIASRSGTGRGMLCDPPTSTDARGDGSWDGAKSGSAGRAASALLRTPSSDTARLDACAVRMTP